MSEAFNMESYGKIPQECKHKDPVVSVKLCFINIKTKYDVLFILFHSSPGRLISFLHTGLG